MKKLIAAILGITLILSACSEDGKNEDTNTNTQTTGTTHSMAENEAFAIDRLSMPSELPGNYYYSQKGENALTLYNNLARIDMRAQNHKEDFSPDLSVYAESAMASLAYTNLLYKTDTVIDKVTDTKVAGFDAIEYDFTLEVNEFEFDAEGNAVIDENGNEKKHVAAVYKSIALFFYSETDAYYIIFETTDADFAAQEKLFRDVIDTITIDSHLTADQTTTQAYNYTESATQMSDVS
ncbi:MAG: hypothetical protein LBM87_05955 [Ruminococcus sp.]|jgi:hypothetical protein|nr:hypothetical protein [Ruminococcus sp.]